MLLVVFFIVLLLISYIYSDFISFYFVERASRYSKQYLHSTSLGDYKSDGSDTNPTFSYCSEITRPSDEGGSPYSHVFH